MRTNSQSFKANMHNVKINLDLFEKFAPILKSPLPPVVRDQRLIMASEGDVKVYYAPFEYLNPEARVVLVGITPGPTQMINANVAAREALLGGMTSLEAVREAKHTGAFSGEPLRTNLISQLNHWGVHEWLKLKDSAELFSSARHLVQTTSLLRYPTFVKDDDYRGNTPNMTKHPLLRKMLMDYFVAETHNMSKAIFVSLGPTVQKVFDVLIDEGVLDGNQVIGGMLHPSGNCTYRINYLVGNRSEPTPHATNPQPYDAGRRLFRQIYVGA